MLNQICAHDLALELEHLLAFERIPDRSIVQCTLNAIVGFFLADYDCLAKIGICVFPAIDCGCVDFKEIGQFVICSTQSAELCSLLNKRWIVIARPSYWHV